MQEWVFKRSLTFILEIWMVLYCRKALDRIQLGFVHLPAEWQGSDIYLSHLILLIELLHNSTRHY
jgi:hypothetical protein